MQNPKTYFVRLGESEEKLEGRKLATQRAKVLSEDNGRTVLVESADQRVRIQYRGGAMFSYDERAPSGRR